jgi:hypothetical protein
MKPEEILLYESKFLSFFKYKNMKNNILIASIFIGLSAFFHSCKEPKEPEVENEEELITTVTLRFTNNADTTDVREFVFKDVDGPGGSNPSQFDTVRLDALGDYTMNVFFLNESVTPAEDITTEIQEEAVDHQLFFIVDPSSLMTITYGDFDINGGDIGLENYVIAGSTGTGTLQVVLKHQPGIKDGNIATGETDVELLFQAEVD